MKHDGADLHAYPDSAVISHLVHGIEKVDTSLVACRDRERGRGRHSSQGFVHVHVYVYVHGCERDGAGLRAYSHDDILFLMRKEHD